MEKLSDNELEEISGGKKGGFGVGRNANGVGNRTSPYFSYTIQPNECLSSIASKFHTTVLILQKLNNIPNADLIRAGRTILIPRETD